MSNQFKEILIMIDRGKSIFEPTYLSVLGVMCRQGLIKVEIYIDGTAVVRKIVSNN